MKFNELYLEYCKEQTDAPEVFHRTLAYLILACSVGRNVYMPFGFKKLYCNLFVLLVAPSSSHRKSWSQGIAVNLIEQLKPEFIIQECSSRESFISEFAQEQRNGQGLIEIDELAGFMSRMKNNKHFQGFAQDLASAYDGKTIRRRKGVSDKGKDTEVFTISDPFLCITAACSNDWLNQSMETSDVTGGGFARYLWAVCEDKNKDPWPEPKSHNALKFGLLVEKLQNISQYVGEAKFSEETAELYKKWYSQFRAKNQGGKWDQNYERLTTIAKKLSMLNCLARMEDEQQPANAPIIVEKKDLGEALYLIEECAEYFGKIAIGDSRAEVNRNKVLNYISKRGKVTRSDILNNIWGLDAWNLSNILETLTQADLITTEEEILLSGRKRTVVTRMNGQENRLG